MPNDYERGFTILKLPSDTESTETERTTSEIRLGDYVRGQYRRTRSELDIHNYALKAQEHLIERENHSSLTYAKETTVTSTAKNIARHLIPFSKQKNRQIITTTLSDDDNSERSAESPRIFDLRKNRSFHLFPRSTHKKEPQSNHLSTNDVKKSSAMRALLRETMLKQSRSDLLDSDVTEKKRNNRFIWYYLTIVPLITVTLFIISFGLDIANNRDLRFANLWKAFMKATEEQASSLASSMVRLNSAGLVALISLTGFILQMSSTRFGPQARNLFFESRMAFFIICFVTSSATYATIISCVVNERYYLPQYAGLICIVFGLLGFFSNYPYFVFLFRFLDPPRIVNHVRTAATNSVHKVSKLNVFDGAGDNNQKYKHASSAYDITRYGDKAKSKIITKIEKRQIQTIKALEALTEIGRIAATRKEKNVVHAVLRAHLAFYNSYMEIKENLPINWYNMPLWLRQASDFATITDEILKELLEKRCWLEYKILQDHLYILVELKSSLSDLCTIIFINFRAIGLRAIQNRQYGVFDLTIKTFNSSLRLLTKQPDVNILASALQQYRMLVEYVLVHSFYLSKASIESHNMDLNEKDSLDLGILETLRHRPHYDSIMQLTKESDYRNPKFQSYNHQEYNQEPKSSISINMDSLKFSQINSSKQMGSLDQCDDVVDNEKDIAFFTGRVVKILNSLSCYYVTYLNNELHEMSDQIAREMLGICEISFLLYCPKYKEILTNTLDLIFSTNTEFSINLICCCIKLGAAYTTMGAIELSTLISKRLLKLNHQTLLKRAHENIKNSFDKFLWEIGDGNFNPAFVPEIHKAGLSLFLNEILTESNSETYNENSEH